MADPQILHDWFAKIDQDIEFLCECFAEVLVDLGESDLASVLPWRKQANQPDTGADSRRIDRELQALAISYHLLNLVEEIAAAQARRERVVRHGLHYEPGLWGHSLRTRSSRGESAEQIARLIRDIHVEIVLTAHPTEAKRPLVLRQHRALFDAFWEMKRTTHTINELDALREQIKVILERLWRTGEMYLVKPDVLSELRYVLDYFTEVFPAAVDEVQLRLREAWAALGLPPDTLDGAQASPRLTFGNWVGGDRDGHPLVTAEVTRETIDTMRSSALAILREGVLELSRDLSFSDFFQVPPRELMEALREKRARAARDEHAPVRELAHEPWREFVRHILDGIDRTIAGTLGAYESPAAVATDLDLLRNSLTAIGASRLARAQVDPLLVRLNTFGFHLAKLDIRQNSDFYARAMGQLLAASGVADSDYASWPKDKRLAFLNAELTSLRPFAPPNKALEPEARATLDCFSVVAEAMRKSGEAGIGSFIVSMTQHVSDLLVVYLFAREAGLMQQEEDGLRSDIRIVPLFETLDDLERGSEILNAFLEHPVTRNSHAAREVRIQQVMVGYSDSNKDAGIFASQWALHRAQRSLSLAAREHDVEPLFFHGRGGTFSRGAGPTHRFLESLPAGALPGWLRVTEQGEMIAQKFGNLPTAVFNLELMLAGVTASAGKPGRPDAEDAQFTEICGWLSEFSAAAYRSLIASDGFLEFWAEATPIDALENSFIGSRPARRSGKRSLDDLRAIPWVFGWAQSRYYLPGWYGVGSALERLEREHPGQFETLKHNIKAWPFVQYVLYNAETSLASADTELMRDYAELVGNSAIREAQFDIIVGEYDRASRMIDAVFGAPRSKRRPRLAKTLEMRAHGLRRMHRRQIELLRRWRTLRDAGSEAEAAELFPTLLLSINGIASAERTTG